MKRIITLVCLAVLTTSLGWAETIYLKNGKKITGKIVQQDDQQLKIDVSGVKITYFADEIDRVEGAPATMEATPAPAAEPVVSSAAPNTPPIVPATVSNPSSITPPAPASVIPMPPTQAMIEPTTNSKKEKILTLINVSGTRESMESMFSQIISEAPPEEATKLKDVFNLDEIINRFVPVYDKYFTEEDLSQLIDFYKSPVGMKLIKVTPLLMEDSMAVSVDYFKEKMPEPPPEKPSAGTDTGTGDGIAAPRAP